MDGNSYSSFSKRLASRFFVESPKSFDWLPNSIWNSAKFLRWYQTYIFQEKTWIPGFRIWNFLNILVSISGIRKKFELLKSDIPQNSSIEISGWQGVEVWYSWFDTNYKIFYFQNIILIKNTPKNYFGHMWDNFWSMKQKNILLTFLDFHRVLPTEHLETLLNLMENGKFGSRICQNS